MGYNPWSLKWRLKQFFCRHEYENSIVNGGSGSLLRCKKCKHAYLI
jgi:hypothetical protein